MKPLQFGQLHEDLRALGKLIPRAFWRAQHGRLLVGESPIRGLIAPTIFATLYEGTEDCCFESLLRQLCEMGGFINIENKLLRACVLNFAQELQVMAAKFKNRKMLFMYCCFLMLQTKEVAAVTNRQGEQKSASADLPRSLFEKMRHGFALHELICDAQGNPADYRFLYVNPAFESMTGLHSDRLIGRTVLEVMPGLERHWIHRYGEVTLTGASQRFEEYSADLGQYYSVYAFSPAHGQFAVIIDNTAPSHDEKALPTKDDSLHRSLFEKQPSAMMVIDPADGHIVDVNHAACQFYGWRRSEFKSKNISDINSQNSEEIGPEMQQAQTGARSRFYFRHRLSGGELRDVEVFAGSIPWDGRSLLCITVHDITAKKKVEEALAESEAKYRAIVDQSSDCVLLIAPETGLILEGNKRFRETLGYILPEEGPLYVADIVVDEPGKVEELLRQATVKGALGAQRRILRHRNGTHIPVIRTGVMVKYGGKLLYNATFRDISMEMRREQEILRDAASAQRIQEALLISPVSDRHITIEALSKAHLYVGGDLYFLDWRHKGHLLRGFLVDTMGHGLGTALHAAAFHVMLREVNDTDLPLDEQVKELNRRAAKHFDDETFAAAIAFEVDLDNCELRWVAAGIPEFYIAADAAWGKMLAPGMYLGINDEETFELRSLPLAIGDCIYFCTDGLTDRLNAQSDLPLGDWAEMKSRFRSMINALECRDDATTVSLRIEDFPQPAYIAGDWPRILRLDGYADYLRRKKEIVRIVAEVTGLAHSRQEVAVNEAIANALECRDAVARGHKASITFRRIGRLFLVRVKTSRIGFAGNAVLERLRAEPDSIFAFGGEAMMGRGILMMYCLSDCMAYNEEGTEVLLVWKLAE